MAGPTVRSRIARQSKSYLFSNQARVALGALVFFASGCKREPQARDARFLAKWMEVHFALARSERLSPLVASRIATYGAVALYEGMRRSAPTLRTLAGQLNGLDSLPSPDPARSYDWPIVTITAERTVLDTLLQEGLADTRITIESLADSQVKAREAEGVSPSVSAASITYGLSLAHAITKWAARDGFARTRGLAYMPPKGRRYWVNTSTADQYTPQSLSAASDFVALDNPSAVLDPGAAAERALLMNRPKARAAKGLATINPTRALEPYWGTLRPFALDSGDPCAPAPPAPYSEEQARNSTSRRKRCTPRVGSSPNPSDRPRSIGQTRLVRREPRPVTG